MASVFIFTYLFCEIIQCKHSITKNKWFGVIVMWLEINYGYLFLAAVQIMLCMFTSQMIIYKPVTPASNLFMISKRYYLLCSSLLDGPTIMVSECCFISLWLPQKSL